MVPRSHVEEFPGEVRAAPLFVDRGNVELIKRVPLACSDVAAQQAPHRQALLGHRLALLQAAHSTSAAAEAAVEV